VKDEDHCQQKPRTLGGARDGVGGGLDSGRGAGSDATNVIRNVTGTTVRGHRPMEGGQGKGD